MGGGSERCNAIGGSQRYVVYLGRPMAFLYKSPNAGGVFFLLRSIWRLPLFSFAMSGKTPENSRKTTQKTGTTRKLQLPERWNYQKAGTTRKLERLKKSKRPESHSLIIGWKTDLSRMYRLYFADFLFVFRTLRIETGCRCANIIGAL